MSGRPDIAVLIHSFAGGGAERMAVHLVNEFIRRGLVVDVVVNAEEGVYRPELDPRGEIFRVGRSAVLVPLRLWLYLRQRQPQSVLSVLVGFNLVAATIRTRSTPITLVLTEQNQIHTGKRRSSWKRVVLKILPHLYRRADYVVGVSPGVAAELVGLGIPEPMVESIPNPVDIDDVEQRSRSAAEHPYFEEGVPVLIAVGSLVDQKDYPTFLAAVALLRTRRDVRALILGEGERRATLERRRADLGLDGVVDFVGFQSPPWPWMARADVFVLSSRFEGWPNVLSEALALGKKVVATDGPTAAREILADGRYGSLVPVGDSTAMAAAIESELDGERESMALRARAAEWAVGPVADRYLSLLLPHSLDGGHS